MRDYEHQEDGVTEVEGEECSEDGNSAIWRRIRNSEGWIDAKSRVESYVRYFIAGKADPERTWYYAEVFIAVKYSSH